MNTKAVGALLDQMRGQAEAALADCEKSFGGAADATGRVASALVQLEQVAEITGMDGIAALSRECRELAAVADEGDTEARRQALAEGLVALNSKLAQAEPGDAFPLAHCVEEINGLRAARGTEPLSPAAVFIDALRAAGPHPVPFKAPAKGTPELQAVAKRVQAPAKKVFAVLQRGGDPKPALDALRKLTASFERAAPDADRYRLWWLARVLVDAALAGSVKVDDEVRQALAGLQAQVDAAAEGKPADPVAAEWGERTLFLLSRAGRGTPDLEMVATVFGFDRLGAGSDAGATADEGATGTARSAVADAARVELARVRDAFDVYLRSGAADVNLLKPAVARIDAVISPLRVADADEAADVLAGARTELQTLIDGQPIGNKANVITAQLLRAEEILGHGVEGPADKLREEAMRALVDAVQDELGQVRQALFEASEIEDEGGLEAAPERLGRMAGSLRVAGLEDAADMIGETASALRQGGKAEVPLDALAEAIVCLEMYLGARRDDEATGDELLVRANSVLRNALPESVRGIQPREEPEPPVVSGDADPDIVEIFIGEGREQAAAARDQFLKWRADPTDAAARLELQRAFHTLKGSGRMVGAMRIAEFSKVFEDLFIKFEERPTEPTPELFELVGSAVAVLPALVEQIETGTDPGLDLGGLRRAAVGDFRQVAAGSGKGVLAATAAREFATLHRWLDAVAGGKSSGQVPQAVYEALESLAKVAEAVGQDAVVADVKALAERLTAAPTPDEAEREAVAAALGTLEKRIGPRESSRSGDAASMDAYREEAQGLLDRISTACDALLVDAADADAVLNMQRVLHTLKGASRVAGFREFSDVAHSLEDVLQAIAFERVVVTPRVLWSLQRVFDSMYGMLESDAAERAAQRAVGIIEELRKISGDEQGPPIKSSGADRRSKPRVVADVERVRSDQFDRALVRALTLGLRSAEIDSKMTEQTMWDVGTIAELLRELGEGAAAIRDLLVRARLAPVHTHAPRWRRTVRQAAEDTGREVELRFEGSAIELDRRLLDALVVPFEHLLRNAVAHGIESPFARRAAGKPASGTIFIRSTTETDGLTIEIEDDGAGIDAEKIKKVAKERGVAIPPGEFDAEKVLAVLATPGFTTAEAVTHASGYGIGLDAVVASIRELGGHLRMETTPTKGTRFTLYLPNPSPVLQVELVRIGNSLVAVPPSAVATMRTVERGDKTVEFDGEKWPFLDLAPIVGIEGARPGPEATTAVLLRAGMRGVAVRVDEALGRHETAMHRLKPGDLREGVCVSGVGLLDGGRLSTVLNVEAALAAADPILKIRPFAFVADDSETARDETVRRLEAKGWRVEAVEDGATAKQNLVRARPQLVVLDIDMPGYDGLEVAEWLRDQKAHTATPVILVSAKLDDDRRGRARELQVIACVAKPLKGVDLENALDLLPPLPR